MTKNRKISKPRSSVPVLSGYLGLVFIFVISALVFSHQRPELYFSAAEESAIFLFALFSYIAAYEFFIVKVYRQSEAGLDFSQKINFKKIFHADFATKLLGLGVCLCAAIFYYFMAYLYRQDFYQPFFFLILKHGLWFLGAMIGYFIAIHFFSRNSNDSYWQLGRFIITFGKEGDRGEIAELALSIVIKAFFLPLMFCSFVGDWQYFNKINWPAINSLKDIYRISYEYIMFVDLCFTVIGYVFAMRLFNSHIRWSERTAGGWFFCLMCYMPFWQIFDRYFLTYGPSDAQREWIMNLPVVGIIWGSTILLLMAIFALSTVHFGMRFSNLTYRGLIAHGTYRWSKHPAYLSKNISWWLFGLPFLSGNWVASIHNCLALVGINFIYYKRAKYEERCLSKAPEYREYVEFIAQDGLFARIKRIFK